MRKIDLGHAALSNWLDSDHVATRLSKTRVVARTVESDIKLWNQTQAIVLFGSTNIIAAHYREYNDYYERISHRLIQPSSFQMTSYQNYSNFYQINISLIYKTEKRSSVPVSSQLSQVGDVESGGGGGFVSGSGRKSNSDLVDLKISLLGDSHIGKTSFLVRYVGNEKEQGDDQTKGLYMMDKTMIVKGARISYNIWEVHVVGQDNAHEDLSLLTDPGTVQPHCSTCALSGKGVVDSEDAWRHREPM
uniref:Uncharacterized protein n=1 Tax=Kalanchoe fedtschenkoi TaxID=63787 RepID=A0A7N0VGF6_KALFE